VAGDEPAASYVMPSLIGMQQTDAQKLLVASGLRTPKIDEVSDFSQPKGTVTSQMPPRGSKINSDTMVEISVAQ
jgi:beta-lactam-binding protein with PASTA domain